MLDWITNRRKKISQKKLDSVLEKHNDYSHYEIKEITENNDLSNLKFKQKFIKDLSLDDSILRSADLSDVFIDGGDFNGTDFSYANLQKTRFNGHCYFKGTNFNSANLSNASLRGHNFNNVDFIHANLKGADFSEAMFIEGANFRIADFSEAILVKTQFCFFDSEVGNFQNAKFHKANLTEVIIHGSDLTSAQFHYAILKGANLMNSNLNNVELLSADLEGATLADADLKYCDMTGAKLTGVDFSGANFQYVKFEGVDFEDTKFHSTKFQGVEFPKVNLKNTKMQKVDLTSMNFEEALLEEAHFEEVKLNGANLKLTNLIKAKFVECELEGVNLQKADLRDAMLDGVNLKGADLREADFEGASLEKANLIGAELTDTNFKNTDLRLAKIGGKNLSLETFLALKKLEAYVPKDELRNCKPNVRKYIEDDKKGDLRTVEGKENQESTYNDNPHRIDFVFDVTDWPEYQVKTLMDRLDKLYAYLAMADIKTMTTPFRVENKVTLKISYFKPNDLAIIMKAIFHYMKDLEKESNSNFFQRLENITIFHDDEVVEINKNDPYYAEKAVAFMKDKLGREIDVYDEKTVNFEIARMKYGNKVVDFTRARAALAAKDTTTRSVDQNYNLLLERDLYETFRIEAGIKEEKDMKEIN